MILMSGCRENHETVLWFGHCLFIGAAAGKAGYLLAMVYASI